jgi:hypothetical protein
VDGQSGGHGRSAGRDLRGSPGNRSVYPGCCAGWQTTRGGVKRGRIQLVAADAAAEFTTAHAAVFTGAYAAWFTAAYAAWLALAHANRLAGASAERAAAHGEPSHDADRGADCHADYHARADENADGLDDSDTDRAYTVADTLRDADARSTNADLAWFAAAHANTARLAAADANWPVLLRLRLLSAADA